MKPCFDFLFEDRHARTFGRAYVCRYDGPFLLQAEEVAGIEMTDPAAILDGKFKPVTPDSLRALSRLADCLRWTPLSELLATD